MCMVATTKFFVSFKGVQGTSQYFHNILFDLLAKIRFGVYIYSFILSDSEFRWSYITQIIICQYGEEL